MRSDVSLKKEIASIIDSAKPDGRKASRLYVAKRVNEYGNECTYRFSESMREELLKRANRPQRKPSSKFADWENGSITQKRILFLKENEDVLRTLSDIKYLMNTYGYDAQEACRVLFKNKKLLPAHFRSEVAKYGKIKTTIYYITIERYLHRVEYFIGVLEILPTSYVERIENFNYLKD